MSNLQSSSGGGWPEVGINFNDQVCIYENENLLLKNLILFIQEQTHSLNMLTHQERWEGYLAFLSLCTRLTTSHSINQTCFQGHK